MMTLKVWNTLSRETRERILMEWVDSPKNSAMYSPLLEDYHHNFDYDDFGKRLKKVLECCYLRPADGKIVVSLEITPTYKPKTEDNKKKPEKSTVNLQSMISTFNDALLAVPGLLKKYGTKPYMSAQDTNKVIYVGDNTEYHSNHKIERFEIYRGRVSVDVYWQGDDTDGTECPYLEDIAKKALWGSKYIIPAESYFDGYRTRTTHGDISISKDELYDAIKALVKVIETKQNG